MTELDKLKIAYEVIRDYETQDDNKAGAKNALTTVKNILANEIAFAVTFNNA
jgi:hypothetical protein